MKIKSIKSAEIHHDGWLKKRFGDCYAAISTDVSLKLRSAVKDVSRVLHDGQIPLDVEMLTRRFKDAPQGINDYDFVFGYKGSDGWIDGSLLSDQALIEYTTKYQNEWEIVQKCLGLTRQKSKHACLPSGEAIFTSEGTKDIFQCDQKIVSTGQGASAQATLLDQGIQLVNEYLLTDGQVIRCTPDHLVLTTMGWVTIHEVMVRGLELVVSDPGPDSTGNEQMPRNTQ
jgi:hypothetical protein